MGRRGNEKTQNEKEFDRNRLTVVRGGERTRD